MSSSESTLCGDQELALQIVLEGQNVFITGPGGTGKSFLIKHIVSKLQERGKCVATTASTGVAAFNIAGQTIHSWSGLGIAHGRARDILRRAKASENARKSICEADVLLVDEISMLSPKFFVALDLVTRLLRATPDKVMGGIQIVIIGDFLQLPAIPEKITNDYPSLWAKYGITESTRFVFQLPLWNEVIKAVIVLSKPHRQENAMLFRMLNEIRIGLPSQKTIDRFQECQFTQFPDDGIKPTTLLVHCRSVDNINIAELNKLEGPPVTFCATFGYTPTKKGQVSLEEVARRKKLVRQHIEGCIISRKPPQDYKSQNDTRSKTTGHHNGPVDPTSQKDRNMYETDISLKVGAQVMLVANLNFESGLVNGTRGVVTNFVKVERTDVKKFDFSEETTDLECPVVLFTTGETKTMMPHRWQTTDRGGIVWLMQVPLKLAWAATIHKAQGLSLTRAVIDLTGTFEYGQAYVALSRVRSLDGLLLKGFSAKVIRAHPSAIEYYRQISTLREIIEHVHTEDFTEPPKKRVKHDVDSLS